MAIQLTIQGVDKTKQIQMNSLRIDNILTNKRDTLEFSILNNTGDTYKPNLGAEVIVLDGATTIFGGIITNIESKANAYGIIQHEINCQDYTRLLDHKLVSNSFTNETVNDIMQFLKDNYFPSGFTITNVDAPVVIEYVAFNYKPLAVCIQELANALNYDWYVDYAKDVHFFAKESTPAPFNLSDSGGTHYYDSLVIRKDNSQIRNSIVVRGGEYIGSQLTTDIQTNGVDDIYPLPYKFSDFGATLTGVTLNIGIDYLDDPNNFDALHNYGEKILRFKTSDTPSSGKTMKVSGKPHLPVILRYRSAQHINAMISAEGGDGIYEYLIKDSSINSREGAIQRAQGEILAYAETLSEGEFVTETSGLRAGMTITVQSTSRGINESFVINKVRTTQRTKDTFLYQVSLITTRTMDLIDVLQRLLLQSTRDITINPNEITDIYMDFGDTNQFTDTMSTFSVHGTSYKWGPSTDTAYWGQSTWS